MCECVRGLCTHTQTARARIGNYSVAARACGALQPASLSMTLCVCLCAHKIALSCGHTSQTGERAPRGATERRAAGGSRETGGTECGEIR